jgi:hypothetical protein
VSGRFILNGSYHLDGFFDEMFAAKDEVARTTALCTSSSRR